MPLPLFLVLVLDSRGVDDARRAHHAQGVVDARNAQDVVDAHALRSLRACRLARGD